MSAVIAAEAADAPVPVKVGKKKLIILVAAALVVLLVIGGGVGFWLKHKAAKAAEAAESEEGGEHAAKKVDPHFVPVFLPLDPFVINLADKEADRFAQIGITLELENAAAGDRIKAYMPAVRNAILLLIAGKTSQALGDRQGKEVLAQEILREAVRPLGIEVPEPKAIAPVVAPDAGASAARQAAPAEGEAQPKKSKEAKDEAAAEDEAGSDDADAEHGKKAKGKVKAKSKTADTKGDGHDAEKSPIVRVHFSSFIIQ